MDMEKFVHEEKYLEDVHEARSATTEASESALSETEEISGKFNQTLVL